METVNLQEGAISVASPGVLSDNVTVTSFDEHGNILKVTQGHNLITKQGRENLAIRIISASQGPWTDIELGTSAQAVASTDTGVVAAITGGGLQRATASVSAINNGSGELSTCQFSYTFTKTDSGTTTVRELAIMNAGNKCLARYLTGDHAIAQNGGITVVHKIPLA